jgi:hypothetical protein
VQSEKLLAANQDLFVVDRWRNVLEEVSGHRHGEEAPQDLGR